MLALNNPDLLGYYTLVDPLAFRKMHADQSSQMSNKAHLESHGQGGSPKHKKGCWND